MKLQVHNQIKNNTIINIRLKILNVNINSQTIIIEYLEHKFTSLFNII